MNSPVDISPNYRDLLLDILHSCLQAGVKVWVFGSRADWSTRDSSDLDLALEGNDILDFNVMLTLKTAFEESSLPYKVDVIDLKEKISDGFKQIVNSHKIPLTVVKNNCFGQRWPKMALKDITNIITRCADKKTPNNEQTVVRLCTHTNVRNNRLIQNDTNFVTTKATKDEITKYALSINDIIMIKDSKKYSNIGISALIQYEASDLLCDYKLAILRPTSKIDSIYLHYALNTEKAKQQIHSYTNKITQFGIRKADIGLVYIPVPPITKQQTIANILRTIDDKIEINHQMNHTLKEIIRALFKSWFVDFDLVRAKMKGHFGDSFLGVPDYIYAAFPDYLVNSEIGDIPKGWEVKELRDIAKQHQTRTKSTDVESDAPKHTLKCCFTFSGKKISGNQISIIINNNKNKYETRLDDDIVLSGEILPHLYKVANASSTTDYSSNLVINISPRLQDWFTYIILGHISNSAFIEYMKTPVVCDEIKIPQTIWQKMGSYKIALPRQEIARAFTNIIQPYIDKIILTTNNTHTLESKRDTIMSMLSTSGTSLNYN